MPHRAADVARAGRSTSAPTHRVSRCSSGFSPRTRVCFAVAALVACFVACESRRAWARDGAAEDAATMTADGGVPDAARPTDASPVDVRPSRPAPLNETTVVAPALPDATPREDRTAAATVLSPRQSPRATDDLGTLLLEVPGANVTRTGGFGAFSTVTLRGSNPDEVRIYVDGIPLNQAVGGAVDLSTLPLGDVERIEVYRGSAPIAFGESALGGIISITTRTPGAAQASARVGGGSFRTVLADATGGGTLGRVRSYAGLHVLRARNDYPVNASPIVGAYQPTNRENADLSQLDGVVRAALSLPGRRELRAGLIGVWRDQGLAALDVYRATAARAETTRALAHLDYESREDLGSSGRLRAALFASEVRDAFSDPLHEIVGVPTRTHDRTRALGARATGEKSLGERAKLTVVAEGRDESFLPRNDLDPATAIGQPATRQSAMAGVELDARVPRLDLDVLPSARLEVARDARTGRDNFGAELPPSAATTRALPVLRMGLLRPLGARAALRANGGYYARIPSFLELYGYNRGVLGNPTLSPERGLNADLGVAGGLEGPAGGLTASATLFGARARDLIVWQTFGSQARAENVASARVLGLELELRARRGRLAATTQATFTDARDESLIAANRGRPIPHHPRTRGYGRLEWRQPVARAGLLASLYADLDGTAGNFSTPSLPLPARLLVGAGAAVEHPGSGLRLVASALNLGDSRVQDVPDYPLPGRSFFVTLEWSGGASHGGPPGGPLASNP